MAVFDTPEPISVTVELGSGDLRVVAGDRTDTVVEVMASDPTRASGVAAAEQTVVTCTDGMLRVTAPKGAKAWKRYTPWGGRESIDVRIELPRGSHLHGEASLVALHCVGILGECRYDTGGGDIFVEQVTGDAELRTGTGAVRVERIGGSATVKNGNGDTWIGEAESDLHVKAANGKITVDRADAAVTAKTANGDIHLHDVASGAVVAGTACGKVSIGVRSGVAAWLDLHTSYGHVRNLLKVSDGPGPSDGTVEVRARTSFGDITVRRAGMADSGKGAA
ncbi:MAG TPA: DUF4097 family beta strand repeat-containing protein [Acidimicrobiales bacterium]|nr:DUF4097 family beta strand repeat-containing protein [Acidimicrobiales bacterium]